MLPAVTSPLVQRLQADFLANTRAHYSSCRFLSEASRDTVGRLLAEDAPARAVGDALFHGFVGDWAARRQALAASLGELSGTPAREYGAERLFEPMPSAEMMFGSVLAAPRNEFLGALTAGCVWEFDYSEAVSRAVVPSGEDQMDTIHSDLSRVGIAVYACDDDGLLTLRVPSLTAFETGLAVFFSKRAARFCLTPGLIPRRELNELHRIGTHAIALPLEATPVHRSDAEHPAEVGLHDVSHTYLWPKPWLRHAGVLLFDAIEATVSGPERVDIDEEEMLLTDLAFGNAADLSAIAQNLSVRLSGKSQKRLFADYRMRMDGFFGNDPSPGLAVLKAGLNTH